MSTMSEQPESTSTAPLPVPAQSESPGLEQRASQAVAAVSPAPQPLMPTDPYLAKRTYASPLSYVGSLRRILAWVKKTGSAGPVQASLAWSAGLAAILFMWSFVTVWYLFTVVLLGWFMVPFRLIRRSQRKSQHVQATQLATMQAMMVAQQQALNQQQR